MATTGINSLHNDVIQHAVLPYLTWEDLLMFSATSHKIHTVIAQTLPNAEQFTQFIQDLLVNPGSAPVKDNLNHCLTNISTPLIVHSVIRIKIRLGNILSNLSRENLRLLLYKDQDSPRAFMRLQNGTYTGSDSRIGNRQGGSQTSDQAQPAPKQPNLNKLGDAGGFEGWAKPTQPEPIIESRAVYRDLYHLLVKKLCRYRRELEDDRIDPLYPNNLKWRLKMGIDLCQTHNWTFMKLLINDLKEQRTEIHNTTPRQIVQINLAILRLLPYLLEKKKWDLAEALARLITGEEQRNIILQNIENKRLQID